jgi:glucose/mannose-6-phosphate isomerase
VLDYYRNEWGKAARRALHNGLSTLFPPGYSSVEEIVVCGMGGSGVVGEYLKSMASLYGGPRVEVVRSFTPPAGLSYRSLVLAVSFSGTTLETIQCARKAYQAGAKLAVVTSGGELLSMAKSIGVPALVIEKAPAARAAWPQLFFTTAGALHANGILTVARGDLEAAASVLEEVSESDRVSEELAGIISREAPGKILAFVAPEHYYPLAVRARNEFAENSKIPSISAQYPELGHNDIEALSNTEALVVAFDPGEGDFLLVLKELLPRGNYFAVSLRGRSLVEKLAWGTWIAGLASVKAAMIRGIDPLATPSIKKFRSALKEKLAGQSAEAKD